MKGVNQCVLTVRLEINIEVDGSAVGRLTQADPVVRDGIPLVLSKNIVPRRRDGRLEANEERSGQGRRAVGQSAQKTCGKHNIQRSAVTGCECK